MVRCEGVRICHPRPRTGLPETYMPVGRKRLVHNATNAAMRSSAASYTCRRPFSVQLRVLRVAANSGVGGLRESCPQSPRTAPCQCASALEGHSGWQRAWPHQPRTDPHNVSRAMRRTPLRTPCAVPTPMDSVCLPMSVPGSACIAPPCPPDLEAVGPLDGPHQPGLGVLCDMPSNSHLPPNAFGILHLTHSSTSD